MFKDSKLSLLLFLVLIMLIINAGFFVSNYKMHKSTDYIMDIGNYSYKKFYSSIREDQLNLDLALEQLNNKPLNSKDKIKLEKICSFQVEDGVIRLEVAKGYDCLLQLYADENTTLPQQYKAIKNGSYGLDVLYTKKAAINLVKLIILGHEEKVKKSLNIKDDNDFLKYYSGYADDEILFLNNLIALDIPELTAKCLYRLSFIHLLGRASFNEQEIKPNYKLATEEIQKVIKLTGIKQNKILDIALIINDKFAPHAATVIASALLNSDLDSFYKFHVVMNPNDPVTEESMEKLASMKYIRDYSIDFISFPKNISDNNLVDKKLKFSDNWPSLVMYRLYFDQIFPNLNSILYLDADIVVLRDLNSFKKIDMTNYLSAGIMDTAFTYGILKIDNNCSRNILNSYKNSGVIFFNLENIRKQQAKDVLLENIQNSKCEFSFPDQDLLNITFRNYIYPLPMRWNFCTHFEDQSPYFSYFIMHYAGRKPWTTDKQKLWETAPNKLNEITKYYWRYRDITPWGNKDFN